MICWFIFNKLIVLMREIKVVVLIMRVNKLRFEGNKDKKFWGKIMLKIIFFEFMFKVRAFFIWCLFMEVKILLVKFIILVFFYKLKIIIFVKIALICKLN